MNKYKNNIINIFKYFGLYKYYKVPKILKETFLKINDTQKNEIKKLIIDNYFKNQNIIIPEIANDIEDHVSRRLQIFRERYIPFILKYKNLKNSDILEIGCGTGSTTIAIAEQFANVTAIDIDRNAIDIAKEKFNIINFKKPEFINANASDIGKMNKGKLFDIIMFNFSLEHMTYEERINSLQAGYKIVKKNGLICVFGTPNRLWFFDAHTSLLPFNFWLPDELAFKYSEFSERDGYNKIFKNEFSRNTKENFYRWGRGASYHEFDIAFKNNESIKVIDNLASFLRKHNFLQKYSYQQSEEYKFKNILLNNGPAHVHEGFYEPYIDIIFKKINAD